jgi:CRISPR-associated protein Cas1
MATVYLDHSELELRPDGPALALYENGTRLRSLPLQLIDRVVVHCELTLTANVIKRIVDGGASMVFLTKRNSQRIATVLGRPHQDARIRLAHYAAALDDDFRSLIAAAWVRAKIRGHRRLLAGALQRRPDQRKPLLDALHTMDGCLLRLPAACASGVPSLMGLEGAAAAAYFPAYAGLFAPHLGFAGRQRRPPPDPVNSSLSLVYTLLHHEAVSAAYAAGLDPYVGFLHAPSHGRESLACDFVEPLRPQADAWVNELFRTRILREEHFNQDNGACLLGKAGRAHFYAEFEKFAVAQRRHLRRLARAVVKALPNRGGNEIDANELEATLS